MPRKLPQNTCVVLPLTIAGKSCFLPTPEPYNIKPKLLNGVKMCKLVYLKQTNEQQKDPNQQTQEGMGEVESLDRSCAVCGIRAGCHAWVSKGAVCAMSWSLVHRQPWQCQSRKINGIVLQPGI